MAIVVRSKNVIYCEMDGFVVIGFFILFIWIKFNGFVSVPVCHGRDAVYVIIRQIYLSRDVDFFNLRWILGFILSGYIEKMWDLGCVSRKIGLSMQSFTSVLMSNSGRVYEWLAVSAHKQDGDRKRFRSLSAHEIMSTECGSVWRKLVKKTPQAL